MHPHRPTLEAVGEGGVVLPRQQSRRADDRHLASAHRHDKGRAQGHLGLAEADVAADQPVHRLAGAEVAQHVGDGVQLVLGLLIGEAGAELVEDAVRRLEWIFPDLIVRPPTRSGAIHILFRVMK